MQTLLFLCLLLWNMTGLLGATEQEIRNMKFRDLRTFLNKRGSNCHGCFEKSDWIEAAILVKDKEVIVEVSKKENFTDSASGKPFWENWSDSALKLAQENGADEATATQIKIFAEDYFQQHGKSTAIKLGKSVNEILETSLKEPYHSAGRILLTSFIKQAMAKNLNQTSNELATVFEKTLIPWITNVAIDNSNPMYEWIKSSGNEV